MLTLRDITASYGPSQALFGVDLELAEGQALALLGRNGMGKSKSTTVKAIFRMIPAQGTLTFDGHDLLRLPSHRAARLGLGLVPEGRRCFSNLTVRENLIAAARPGHWDLTRIGALFPRLEERMGQGAGTLSGGEQQMLAIGRALMTNPRLLVLDEATEGLAPLIRAEIWEAIGALKRETGLSLIVIDKSLTELRGICDTAAILERGRTVWSGPMPELGEAQAKRFLGL
ncbi:MAG: ABC transporter ATP-binding protein [Shimia sp.]